MLAGDDKNSVLCEVGLDDSREIAYSPYGHSAGGMGVLGFNGEVREAHVGWYLLGNGYRAFNPGFMRFCSPDDRSPFGAGRINTYAYCGGDPVSFTDPTGHVFGLGRLGKFISRLFGRTSKTAAKTAQSAPVSQGVSHAPRSLQDLYPENTGAAFGLRFRNSQWQYDPLLAVPASGRKPPVNLSSGSGPLPESASRGMQSRRALSAFDFLEDMSSSSSTGYVDHSTRGQMPLPELVSPQRSLPAPVKRAPNPVKAQPSVPTKPRVTEAERRKIRQQEMEEIRAKDRKKGIRW